MTLDELDKAFEKLINEIPEAKKELVKKVGEKMYQGVMNNISSSTNEDTGNLKTGVTKHIDPTGRYSAIRPDYKTAPHTHLLENGHKIVKNGKVIGWVPGQHMYRNALNQLADEMEEDAKGMLKEMVGDIFD